MKSIHSRHFILALFGLVVMPGLLQAVYVRSYPITLTQPDGEVIKGYVTGDEFHRRVHDADGYTIAKNPESGYYVYAIRQIGKVIPSTLRVGTWNAQALGLEKDLGAAPAEQSPVPESRLFGSQARLETIKKAPLTGTLNNIVIFIRFSGETEFGDTASVYDNWFNNVTSGYNSMRNYFSEASYGQLAIATTFYPLPSGGGVVSYQDSHVRAYYQPYDAVSNTIGYTSSEFTSREHTLLKNAVDATSSQIPSGLNIDGDNDGYADNVCFIVKGDSDGWSDLLWPHMWALYSQTAFINGKRVWDYDFQLQNFTKSRGVGVLCHEMFHSLGSPDLYRYYSTTIEPVGTWDVMAYDHNPPQHMGAYMKYQYGKWISSIPEITTSGAYTLNPLTSATNNCYKIKSPASSSEYFVVEFRKRTGTFEGSLSGDGLLVYRINTATSGNAGGPPDEVYIYRPDGTLTQNGNIYAAPFSLDSGRTAINDSTNPSSFLSTGANGKLNLSNVSLLGTTISFTIGLGPSLAVTGPAAATNWYRGSTLPITWTKSGTQSANVKLQLYKGTTMVKAITLTTPNDGSFDWTIPAGTAPAANYRVRVTTVDNKLSAYSGYFSISKPTITIAAPTTGTVWTRGTTQMITWVATGTQNANVKIQLFRGTTKVLDIALTAPNSGDYSWPIPSFRPAGANYKVKVKTSDGVVTAASLFFTLN